MNIKTFRNWSQEDFVHSWDSVEYTFKVGESKQFEAGVADHFAKHLAQRELLRDKKLVNDETMKVYIKKAFVEAEVATPVVTATPVVSSLLAKKKGRPAKVQEEEFADLNK